MITSFSMQANGCSYEDYKHANYGNGDGTPAEEISFTIWALKNSLASHI